MSAAPGHRRRGAGGTAVSFVLSCFRWFLVTEPCALPLVHDPGADEASVAADARFRDHYGELRRMARSRLRHHETFTLLDTTALVHESFLRLSRAGGVRSTDEPAFLAYAGRVMRSVIVDAARSRLTIRRGEGIKASELDDDAAEQVSDAPAQIIIDLHDALLSLQSTEPRLAQVIELQYFGGMADAEVAVALGMSDRTVRRDADRARMMLRALLA